MTTIKQYGYVYAEDTTGYKRYYRNRHFNACEKLVAMGVITETSITISYHTSDKGERLTTYEHKYRMA